MKIATWNCNSIRARLPRVEAWLSQHAPDVLCLQELKCTEADFPHEAFTALGYQVAVHGQKTYNGVAIVAKAPIEQAVSGLADGVDDLQARVIAATVSGVRVICVYAPNGQSLDSPAYAYKLEWYQRLRRYLDAHQKPDEPLVLCGDFNIAPLDLDVHDPALWEGQVLCSAKERSALAHLSEFGLSDVFREKHPGVQAFSWWDYRTLAFPKNQGLRIDYLLATRALSQHCTQVEIDREARKGKQPSDHAPVWAEFSLNRERTKRVS